MVEVFESRPHKTESFVVEREKEVQEWNEQKLSKVLPGSSRGGLPGRSTKEAGGEEEEEKEKSEERESPKRWLMASRRRQFCTEMQCQLHEEQSGRVSCTVGTARNRE